MRGSGSYLAQDTIVAPITAVGGAVAMLRVSGPETGRILGQLSGGLARSGEIEPRRLVRADLVGSAGEVLDDGLVAWFPKPNSYTGEDVAEIHVHGGGWTVIRVVEAILALGARSALPGEFSFRAVRNGKMDLSQAEAVADLIQASNEVAATLALEKMKGTQSDLVSAIAEDLRKLSTLGEVGIDFSDQDIEELSLRRLQERARELRARLERLSESYDRGAKIQDGIRTAIVGKPNAGKSSFFNALLGEDRAIVSEVAGTTRDILREKVTLRGTTGSVTLRLEDTAGLRDTHDPVERMGVERTKQAGRSADLVIWVIDVRIARAEAGVLTREELASLPGRERPIIVLSQCDRVTHEESTAAQRAFEAQGFSIVLKTSAVTGEGVPEAARAIADACSSMTRRAAGEVLLTRQTQVDATREAMSALDRAVESQEIELFAADIRHALVALVPLFGETPTEDILTRIFSTFCIGK